MTRWLAPVVLALAFAPAAQAAYPGAAGGKLVFFQQGVGGTEAVGLAVSAADGSGQAFEPLGPRCGSEDPAVDPNAPCALDPLWSPDGERIAFGLGGTIATMKPDGSDVQQLPLSGFARVTSPSYSPDGTRLAFSAVRGGKRDVYITNLAGTTVVALTKRGGASPAWSVKNEIAFTRKGSLWRIPAAGGKAVRLTKKRAAQPTWSPTGNEVAFVRRVRLKRKSKKRTDVLYRLGRTGKGLKRLTKVDGEDPSWTPDGKAILFAEYERDFANEIIRSVGRNGGKVRLVTTGSEGRRFGVSDPDQQPLR